MVEKGPVAPKLIIKDKDGRIVWIPFDSSLDAGKIISEQESLGSVILTAANSVPPEAATFQNESDIGMVIRGTRV